MPCRSGFSNVVCSTTPAHARELEAMSSAAFGAAVTHALHSPADVAAPLFPQAPYIPDFIQSAAPIRVLENLQIPDVFRSVDAAKAQVGTALFGAAAGAEKPPVVSGWEGQAPRSFPLSVQHAGRYMCLNYVITIPLLQWRGIVLFHSPVLLIQRHKTFSCIPTGFPRSYTL